MQVKLFADLREIAGQRRLSLDVEGDPVTVGSVIDRLVNKYPDLEERILDDGEVRPHIHILLNGRNAGIDEKIEDEEGTEVAIFPPVSGGLGGRSYSSNSSS
ncbi:MAG: ubiquitin-like small modifier protein 1 [Halobacteria archaeon]|nr:ubiquitin-like small modifier protein 1 [Halobacteria archaeon]